MKKKITITSTKAYKNGIKLKHTVFDGKVVVKKAKFSDAVIADMFNDDSVKNKKQNVFVIHSEVTPASDIPTSTYDVTIITPKNVSDPLGYIKDCFFDNDIDEDIEDIKFKLTTLKAISSGIYDKIYQMEVNDRHKSASNNKIFPFTEHDLVDLEDIEPYHMFIFDNILFISILSPYGKSYNYWMVNHVPQTSLNDHIFNNSDRLSEVFDSNGKIDYNKIRVTPVNGFSLIDKKSLNLTQTPKRTNTGKNVKPDDFAEIYNLYMKREISRDDLCKKYGVSKYVINRWIQEHREENGSSDKKMSSNQKIIDETGNFTDEFIDYAERYFKAEISMDDLREEFKSTYKTIMSYLHDLQNEIGFTTVIDKSRRQLQNPIYHGIDVSTDEFKSAYDDYLNKKTTIKEFASLIGIPYKNIHNFVYKYGKRLEKMKLNDDIIKSIESAFEKYRFGRTFPSISYLSSKS